MGSTEKTVSPGMKGMMGETIAFFRLFRQTGLKVWEEKAEVLLDEVMECCTLDTPTTYDYGLCGVGVGIEYLIQEGFVDGNSDEILLEVDSKIYSAINQRSLQSIGLEEGVCGLAYYLYFRLHWRLDSDDRVVLRSKEHLIYLIDWIADLLPKSLSSSNLGEVYVILCLLHQLDVLNAKIEKLMDYCLKEIFILKS